MTHHLHVCMQLNWDTDIVAGSGSSCCVCGFCSPSRCRSVGSYEALRRQLVAGRSWARPASACCSSSSSSLPPLTGLILQLSTKPQLKMFFFLIFQQVSEYLGPMFDPMRDPCSSRKFHSSAVDVTKLSNKNHQTTIL